MMKEIRAGRSAYLFYIFINFEHRNTQFHVIIGAFSIQFTNK